MKASPTTTDDLAKLGLTIVDPGRTEPKVAAVGTWEHAFASALADVRATLGTSATPTVSAPLFADAVDLLGRQFEDASWLVAGLVTRGGITTIGGEPKTAKTWLATELAVSVATGTKVCGEFFAERGRVAYFYAEDQARQVRNRLRALLAGQHRTLEPGRFLAEPRGEFLDITRDEDLARIVASCRRFGPLDLLILDPLRDVSSAAEDKSDEMAPVMRRLRLLAELLTCTVAIVHHKGKSSVDTSKRRPGQQLRGSGAIHGSTDSGIYLGDLDGDGATTFANVVDSEVKGARSAGRFTLELTIEDDEQGEAVSARWKVSRDSKSTVKATAKATAEQTDDDATHAFVAKLAAAGESHSRRALRDHDARPLPDKRFRASLDRLIDSGRLFNEWGKVVLTHSDAASELSK